MPEYVYALHDFLPENEDEVDFRAGERIEVIEKDDLYGDGWWQGRNLAGKVGLFPQTYTTPGPPAANGTPASTTNGTATTAPTTTSSSTVLQPLAEESETESPTTSSNPIISPVPRQPQPSFLNGHDSDKESLSEDQPRAGGDGEVMKATMTDVQKAIEQLGRNRTDPDGGRSFSFASTRDGGETDTDFDLSDVDGTDDLDAQGDWHKGARRKLAEKARKAVEDAQKLEAMMSERSTLPPIDVELSDESEDEGDNHDFTRSSAFARTHPHIPEEDEDDQPEVPRHAAEPSTATTSTVTPQPIQPEATKSTATLAAQTLIVPQLEQPEVTTATQPTFEPPPIEKTVTLPVQATLTNDTTTTQDTSKRNSAPTLVTHPPPSALHSPSASHGSGSLAHTTFQASQTSISTNPTSFTQQGSPIEKKEKKNPSEWSLEEVIEWLQSKGFDQDVCDKFREQEITGDVLLELDINVLKSEIGIAAFGKRMRIANAITELRRPPSIGSFDPQSDAHSHNTAPSVLHHHPHHQRSLSHSHSLNSYPGTPLHSQTPQGSSPMALAHPQNGNPLSAPSELQYAYSNFAAPASPPPNGTTNGVGLGIDGMGAEVSKTGGRPSHLTLSPSEGNLKSKVIIDTSTIRSNEDEDRAHMSDGEVAAQSQSVRRRLFGRSQDSSMSVGNSSRTSKDGSSPAPSPSHNSEKDVSGSAANSSSTVGTGARHKGKKSVDRSNDRLSIFGNTFGGSLGKGRKPPPTDDGLTDSKSGSMFSRLATGSVRKSSANHRPSTPSESPKANSMDAKDRARNASAMTTASSATVIPDLRKKPSFDERRASGERQSGERATLRKRTVSGPAGGGNGVPAQQDAANKDMGDIKQGLSIIEQVGEPDHTGWMRKKGVRYNSWKNRYFILKGEHLYILRSNNKAETRLKGYVNIHGYKVTVDETQGPGRYGFRIDHDHDKTHHFNSDEKPVIREWMKAIMKATIGRDYTKPVVSSCNIPTIPLVVAQAMNPAPRPPSPTARDATQKALRRENPNQLSSRDARVLMGLPSSGEGSADARKNMHSLFADEPTGNGMYSPTTPKTAIAPPRPSREMRRGNSIRSTNTPAVDESLIDWGNSHLSESLQVYDVTGPLFSGLALLRIAESIKGKPASPPVPDSAFPSGPSDDKLDGLFRLFDFLLDNDVKMGSVSINDVRQGKRDKIVQLLKALKAWEDKRKALAMSMGTSVQVGGFMAPAHYSPTFT